MSAHRFFAIAAVFVATSLGWAALSSTMEFRTAELKDSLSAEVNSMWGPPDLMQHAPAVGVGKDKQEPLSSDIRVDFQHDLRYKGLLWFSTYTVAFNGTYEAQTLDPANAIFTFHLPKDVKFLEDFTVTLDGQAQADAFKSGGSVQVSLPPDGQSHKITVAYKTRGRDSWLYSSSWPGQSGPALLRNFTLQAVIDFNEIDYPDGSISPTEPAQPVEGGMAAIWQYNNLLSEQTMGIKMPSRTNAGTLTARMSLFAPVSLFFFFTVLFTVVVRKKIPLHPMHYLFIAAGFFAFHILMAYLVDVISIQAAFWTCAAVSVLLVVSYMRLVAGVKFALFYVGLAQLVYLVGFSYAFFWEGRTGLTVTIGAIATLFVLMQATGRMDWQQVFLPRNASARPSSVVNCQSAKPEASKTSQPPATP